MAFTLQINEKAPDFSLPGADGNTHALADYTGDVLVVIFWCNHCPYVIGSEKRLIGTVEAYKSRGVDFVAINSNETENHPTDDFPHMRQRAKEQGYNFDYLRDDSQDVARAYGALRTPHVFVFDKDRKLRYTGRMDDNPRNPGMEKTAELREALEALLAGRSPEPAVTNPIGCNVKWQGRERHWMPAEACDLV